MKYGDMDHSKFFLQVFVSVPGNLIKDAVARKWVISELLKHCSY